MILKNVERNDNFVIFEYIATWPYGFDFMLDVTQLIINSDFKHNVTRFAYAPLGTDLKDRLLDLKTFQYNVKRCYYGHLHGSSIKEAIEGAVEGNQFKLVSADALDFKLIKI